MNMSEIDSDFCPECESYLDDGGICGECGWGEDCDVDDDDIVNQPTHYARWVIEPITYIMKNEFEFWRGNILKYVSRAGYKMYEGKTQVESEITDLQKVIRYAEMRINDLNGEDTL